eukprot:443734-Rhodomonas_salina.2
MHHWDASGSAPVPPSNTLGVGSEPAESSAGHFHIEQGQDHDGQQLSDAQGFPIPKPPPAIPREFLTGSYAALWESADRPLAFKLERTHSPCTPAAASLTSTGRNMNGGSAGHSIQGLGSLCSPMWTALPVPVCRLCKPVLLRYRSSLSLCARVSSHTGRQSRGLTHFSTQRTWRSPRAEESEAGVVSQA